jgi:hypothetical protein
MQSQPPLFLMGIMTGIQSYEERRDGEIQLIFIYSLFAAGVQGRNVHNT